MDSTAGKIHTTEESNLAENEISPRHDTFYLVTEDELSSLFETGTIFNIGISIFFLAVGLMIEIEEPDKSLIFLSIVGAGFTIFGFFQQNKKKKKIISQKLK